MAIKFSTKYQDEPKEKSPKVSIKGGRRAASGPKRAKSPPMIKAAKFDLGKKPKGYSA